MFETDQFKDRLKDIISNEAATNQLKEYEVAVVEFLFSRARDNEATLMRAELTKSAALRRGMTDAIQSARVLAKAASALARSESRTVLTAGDMEKAFQAHFCRVWPFCR